MRLRRNLAASCLLSAALVVAPPAAFAQTSPDAGGVTADGVVVPADTTPIPSGGAATTPETDDALPINPEIDTPPAETTPVPASGVTATTPVPPGYLTPGTYASVQPVSGVANLDAPDVPLEPVRLAALIAALIATLLVGLSVLSRTLGLRTAVRPPVATAPGGRLSRTRDRFVLLADDVRDFLRHSR